MKEKTLKSPILQWIFANQPCTGKELAETAGIAQQTLSDARTGRADFSTATLWKIMQAIAQLEPNSSVAEVTKIIEGKKNPQFLAQMKTLIASADEEELEQIFSFLGERLFSKSADLSEGMRDLQSTYR